MRLYLPVNWTMDCNQKRIRKYALNEMESRIRNNNGVLNDENNIKIK